MPETHFKYDVFLSHNTKDKPAVEKIARILRDEYHLKVWLDKWNLTPGNDSQEELEEGLDNSETIAVFLGEAGFGKWENKEMRAAINARINDSSRRVIPVFLPSAPENFELPSLLSLFTWVNLRTGFDTKDLLYLLYCGVKGQAPGDYDPLKPVSLISRDAWHLAHPYPMPPNFTGRVAEREMLIKWLNEDSENRIFILRALGGFGKSALTWHWLTHDVDPKEWNKVLWWSFYEGDASFEHFIEETLKYLKLEIPQGQRPQVDELLNAMQGQKILLIMDGFERALRAYSSMNAAYQGDEPKIEENQLDCVNINAEIFLKSVCSLPNIKSKVLMTTRLTPRALKPRGEFMLGCREVELTAMQKADAVEFFHKQKIKGTHAEIEAACAPYGYHPLSLRLLAGRILKDFENPADIVVAQKLKIDGDIIQQKHHVLEVSYDSLSKHEQKLLSTIACFRSPVELTTLQSIIEEKISLNDDLHDLVERGLLHFDEENKKFDLHPIIRHFAYNHLTAPERTGVHVILVVYFEAVPQLQKIEELEDLAPVIELYHHTVRAGKLDEAFHLFDGRLHNLLYYRFGVYQLYIDLASALFTTGVDNLPTLKNQISQEEILGDIANSYSMSGQPQIALQIYKTHNELCQKIGDSKNLGRGLLAIARQQIAVGAIHTAEVNLRKAIALHQEIRDEGDEAEDHRTLGNLLSCRAVLDEAEGEFLNALSIFEKHYDFEGQGLTWSYRVVFSLLRSRASSQSKNYIPQNIIQFAQSAFELAEKGARIRSPIERNFVLAHWLLGAAYRLNGQFSLAEQHLSEALTRDRAINLVDSEANILLDLARLRYDQKNYEEAKSLAEEALSITERCGYVLQGADVNLFLAQYALEQEKDKVKAKEYAETALKLATCDGPPYYYKVAYHEAERMLEKLK